MARKPSYDFERREREKAKAAKVTERIKAKAERSVTTKPDEEKGEEEKPDAKAE